MHSEALLQLAQSSLEDLKARDIHALDVRLLTTVTDYLLIASGTSDRHVKSMADQLIENAKLAGQLPLGVEGREAGEWVLIDLADVVVHVM
jgi:ribosome-associated protein